MRAFLCLLLTSMAWAGPPAGPTTITPAQCREQRLPPLTVKFDTTGSNMFTTLLPDPQTYFRLSGPPGGPQILDVQTYADPEALLKRFGKVERGIEGTCSLSGKTRQTLGFITGQSLARTRWCAIWVEPEENRPGVVVVAGAGAGQGPVDNGLSTLRHIYLKPILESLRFLP